jgi:hypothetical protein
VALRDAGADPAPAINEMLRWLELYRPPEGPPPRSPLSRSPDLEGERPWDAVLSALWEGDGVGAFSSPNMDLALSALSAVSDPADVSAAPARPTPATEQVVATENKPGAHVEEKSAIPDPDQDRAEPHHWRIALGGLLLAVGGGLRVFWSGSTAAATNGPGPRRTWQGRPRAGASPGAVP